MFVVFPLSVSVLFEIELKNINRPESSISTAFDAVQMFFVLILSVLAQHVNLILALNRFLCDLPCKKVGSNCGRVAFFALCE